MHLITSIWQFHVNNVINIMMEQIYPETASVSKERCYGTKWRSCLQFLSPLWGWIYLNMYATYSSVSKPFDICEHNIHAGICFSCFTFHIKISYFLYLWQITTDTPPLSATYVRMQQTNKQNFCQFLDFFRYFFGSSDNYYPPDLSELLSQNYRVQGFKDSHLGSLKTPEVAVV